MNKAAFSLDSYTFDKIEIDLSELKPKTTFNIDFAPSGKYFDKEQRYLLNFIFTAKDDVSKKTVIKIRCIAHFSFRNIDVEQDIPDYFYANSIAILFPYIRAFVSTITLQANVPPIVLPTLNLSDLKDILKANTERV